ncbi:hypothetical protein [Sphingomonas oryzagri]
MALQVFLDYRDKMLAIMEQAEKGLGHAVPSDSLSLDLARTRMARVLTAYHLFADREMFGPCAARDPSCRQRVQAVALECAVLTQDFRGFTRGCALSPVIDRWASYRLDALAMMARIRKHLAAAEMEARYCVGTEKAAATSYRSAA